MIFFLATGWKTNPLGPPLEIPVACVLPLRADLPRAYILLLESTMSRDPSLAKSVFPVSKGNLKNPVTTTIHQQAALFLAIPIYLSFQGGRYVWSKKFCD